MLAPSVWELIRFATVIAKINRGEEVQGCGEDCRTGVGGNELGKDGVTDLLRTASKLLVGSHRRSLEERLSILGRLQKDSCKN